MIKISEGLSPKDNSSSTMEVIILWWGAGRLSLAEGLVIP